MGIECGIHLQNPTNSFFPGETIYGRIVIVNDSQRNVKGLKVSFEGKCEVNFTESERRRRPPTRHNHDHGHGHGHGRGHERRHHQHGSHSSGHHDDHHHGNEISDYETVQVRYTAEEPYLSSELNIFGNDGSDVIIPAGRYEYPFTYILPHGLPSSYGGSHGKVTYSIRAVLPRSWAFDCKTKTAFHVNGLLDLNMHPEAQQDSQLRQHKDLGCCCFSSGTVSFVLKLQKRGVAVGGFVPFVVEINNGSDQTVKVKGSMSICQEVKFYAQGKTKTEKHVICTVEGPSILRGEDELWRGNVLQVPQIPPTGLGGGCHLIDIKYFLKIVLSGTGVFSTLESKTPIIIGTIPFRSTQNVFYEPPPPYNSVSSSYNSPSTGPSAPVFPPPAPGPANIGFNAQNTGGYPDSSYPPTENYLPDFSKSAIN